MERGDLPDNARRAARFEFGNIALARENVRDAWGWTWLRDLVRDIRHGCRSLQKTPAVTIAAILSLALGIGANTAVFMLIDGIMLRPMPVAQPDRLMALSTVFADGKQPDGKPQRSAFSLAMLRELQSRQHVFSGSFAWSGGGMSNFEANGELYAAALDTVTGDYFATLGIRPFLGRFIAPDDVALYSGTSEKVAVLSYRCWQRRFRGNTAVLGKIIRVDGIPLTIIGVAPENFAGLQTDAGPDVTAPVGYSGRTTFRDRVSMGFDLVGRLRPGVSQQQANAQLAAIWPEVLKAALPDAYQGQQRADFLARRIVLQSAATGNSYMRERLRQPLAILMALVAIVLLIASANIAILMLARSAARSREVQIRRALGAGLWRLTRASLIESCLLSVPGAALGIVLALWMSRMLLNTLWTGYVPTTVVLLPDWRVLAFTAALALIPGVLVGLAPARRLLRSNSPVGQPSSRAVTAGKGRFEKALIGFQAALCIVLIVGASLFAGTLWKLRSIDAGFQRDNLLTLSLFPQPGHEKIVNRPVYYRGLANAIEAIPGVAAVSYSYGGPATRGEFVENVSSSSATEQPAHAFVERIAPRFFESMGMRVISGRGFSWQDDDKSARVAIVSESLARRLFAGRNPIGQKLDIGSDPDHKGLEIAGVVNNASLWRLQSREPMAVYMALMQEPGYDYPLLDVRTIGDPRAFGEPVRRVVEAAGHHYPLRIQTLRERSDSMLSGERVLAILSGFLAGAALLIAAIGIYGLLSYSVTRRTSEIGIRMALGAKPGIVARSITREGLGIVAAGMAVGVVIELFVHRFISSVLFGLSGLEPAIVAASGAILICVALMAAYPPARRASRVDPMLALRHE
jgi:predicted permease